MAFRNSIKILGAYGGKGQDTGNTCIQVSPDTLIDAGNILIGLGDDAKEINNIFLTHSHLDHIIDIPFIIDNYFEYRKTPIKIYAIKDTIKHLENHIFNWNIWPDFCEINLQNDQKAIELIEINYFEPITLECGTTLTPIKNNHTTSSCGYIISKNNNSILFSSDTCVCEDLIDIINNTPNLNAIIYDISFPNKYEKLAYDSKHMTPKLLWNELKKINKDVRVYINHLKPTYKELILNEIDELQLTKNGGKVLEDGDVLSLSNEYKAYNQKLQIQNCNKTINQLIEIGHSLTSEQNIDVLLEKILLGAKNFTNADGGTLYLLNDETKKLNFTVVQTDSLNIKMGGTHGQITWPELPLFKEDNSPNKEMVAALCALDNKLINIPDVYEVAGFNFEGTKKFDANTGYRTKSMLVVPMQDYNGDVIGVIQLLNKLDENGHIVEFNHNDKKLILSMASQAAIALTNIILIKNLENLLNSFIKSIAAAIDEKSPYTGGHIGRVAELTNMIVDAINNDETIFKDKNYSDDEKRELRIAAWMHDVGKISTPEHIVDKATKLETIFDRIEYIKVKFELLKKEKEIEYLKTIIKENDENKKQELLKDFENTLQLIDEDLEFIIQSNTGGEFMAEDKIQRIYNISSNIITINNQKQNILNDDEILNLSIKKGTLTDEERLIINNHAKVSIKMLESLPFPKKLKNIPKYAGGHHEKICGGGYPNNLKGDEICFEARILAIADIFEALTANDRPYKKANSLNQSLRILSFMVKDGELDRDIVKFFIDKELHLEYARKNLRDDQIDKITVDFKNI